MHRADLALQHKLILLARLQLDKMEFRRAVLIGALALVAVVLFLDTASAQTG